MVDSSGDRIIVKACLNGARGRDANSNVPWTPREVADDAVRCHEAGAAVVHFHARADDGGVSYDPAWYAETDRLIRERCDLVLNHTTIRPPGVEVGLVLEYLRGTPEPVDMVSLVLGDLRSWRPLPDGGRASTLIENSYEDIRDTLEVCYERGIVPEPTLWDGGMLNNAITLVEDGLLRSAGYFLIEPNGDWGNGTQRSPGSPRDYLRLAAQVREHFPQAIHIAHGGGRHTFSLATVAMATGAHVRVGFEDSPTLPDDPQPDSNARFVEWAVRIARALGREPLSPAEARPLLGLA
jgi:uncharacterized protein (DUF849 family)